MTKTKTRHGYQYTETWHIDKPHLVKPKITGSKIIDGVKYYLGINGKIYIASLFDKMFA